MQDKSKPKRRQSRFLYISDQEDSKKEINTQDKSKPKKQQSSFGHISDQGDSKSERSNPEINLIQKLMKSYQEYM